MEIIHLTNGNDLIIHTKGLPPGKPLFANQQFEVYIDCTIAKVRVLTELAYVREIAAIQKPLTWKIVASWIWSKFKKGYNICN